MTHHRPVTMSAGFGFLTGIPIVTVGFSPASGSLVVRQGLDYPLARGTRWTYHLHQELGPGVSFGPEDAKLAKGSVLVATVLSEAVQSEPLAGRSYMRVDSTRSGRTWLSEWYDVANQGLFVAKRVEDGQPTVLNPSQKWLSASLRTGETWDWVTTDAPVSMHTIATGEERVTVAAGAFQTVKVSSDLTVQGQISIQVHQDRWFARGVDFVKQDTTTSAGAHMLSHVVLTLEKFTPAA